MDFYIDGNNCCFYMRNKPCILASHFSFKTGGAAFRVFVSIIVDGVTCSNRWHRDYYWVDFTTHFRVFSEMF